MKLNNSCLKLALAALMILLPGIAWGGGGGTTYYNYSATLTATASGNGKVYVSDSEDSPNDDQWKDPVTSKTSPNSNATATSWSTILYAHAKADTGYEFTGWDKEGTDKDNPKEVNFSLSSDSDATRNKSQTVTAYFFAKKYTIEYSSDGGVSVPNKQTYYITTTSITIPSDKPSRNGYTFDGWTASYKDPSEGGGWNTSEANYKPEGSIDNKNKSVYGNVILTAEWTKKTYTITYASEEPCDGLPYPDTEHKQQYDIETNPITLSDAVPKRDGHEFTGWIASFEQGDSDHGGWESRTYSNGEEITTNNQYYGNVTLTAGWAKEADPSYIKVTVSGMLKDDHAIFNISYEKQGQPAKQQIAIHEYAIVKIPGGVTSVTVEPSKWTEKTYTITPDKTTQGVTAGNTTTFGFAASKSGQNIFEISREF